MSNETSFGGEIGIDPPLTNAELASCPFVTDKPYESDRAFKVQVREASRETDEGTLTVREGVALVPLTEDPYKAYSFMQDMREFVAVYGEKRSFSGRISGTGVDSDDDFWFCEIRDGRPVKVRAQVVWPDELDAVHEHMGAVRGLLARHNADGDAVSKDALALAAANLCRAVAAFTVQFEDQEEE